MFLYAKSLLILLEVSSSLWVNKGGQSVECYFAFGVNLGESHSKFSQVYSVQVNKKDWPQAWFLG